MAFLMSHLLVIPAASAAAGLAASSRLRAGIWRCLLMLVVVDLRIGLIQCCTQMQGSTSAEIVCSCFNSAGVACGLLT